MSLATLDASQKPAIIQALARDGACIVRNVLSEAVCDRLLDDFAPHLDRLTWGEDELGYRSGFYGEKTKRLHGLFSKCSAMEAVLTHPLLLDVAHEMVVEGSDARDLRLSNAELMVLSSGQCNQVFHTDDASWPLLERTHPEVLISANCALTPFTEENGATRVVQGSHLWETPREPRAEEVCLAIMPRGAALLYSGRVVHSGGEHRASEARVGLYLGYAASWLRPLENHLLTNAPEDVLGMSERARTLLDVSPGGFTVYA